MIDAVGQGRLCDMYGEFLRLTMRGLIFPRLLSRNNFATTSNNWRYHSGAQGEMTPDWGSVRRNNCTLVVKNSVRSGMRACAAPQYINQRTA